MNSLPKTITRQRRSCDLNPGPSAPESGTLTTRQSGVVANSVHTADADAINSTVSTRRVGSGGVNWAQETNFSVVTVKALWRRLLSFVLYLLALPV